jgi:L-serine/L-threonine ammonia-lyase
MTTQRKISRLISSSGGNAGNAVAHAGYRLGIPVSVYVPSTTKQMMVDRLRSKGASVTVAGKNWNEADEFARQTVHEQGSTALYVPPFDDPLIWQGNSSLVHEIAESNIGDVDAIALSVGGGGLLCGIMQGIEDLEMKDKTTVLAVETAGAASFSAAKNAGKPVKIDKIDTIATSLGGNFLFNI